MFTLWKSKLLPSLTATKPVVRFSATKFTPQQRLDVVTKQSGPVLKKNIPKEVIVNTKYDKCSDPLYQHLVYSTEVDVFLTAKRGEVWLQRVYAQKLAAKRELRDRQHAAQSPSVPLALQYLYAGSTVVQGERNQPVQDEEILEAKTCETAQLKLPPVFPYSVHQSLDGPSPLHRQEDTQEEVQSDHSDSDRRRGRGRGTRGRGKRSGLNASDKQKVEGDPQEGQQNFHVLGQDFGSSDEIRQVFSEDHLFKYGTPNPELPETGVACGGCGAHLHSRAENIPGYIPSQLLEGRGLDEWRKLICQRCYIIKEYDIALKVSVSPEDYPKTIQHLKDKPALIILVVDLLDFPGSVWPNILSLLGKNKKIILVGNKLDLLLPDQSRYIRHIQNVLKTEFLKKCYEHRKEEEEDQPFPNIISTICVSAKTGLNVELLIEQIFTFWRRNNYSLPGDVYILGCTNVGKSSLFNMLLESDLCKIRATDLVQKAITSPLPGTTLNLLRFPVTRPEPQFTSERASRLRSSAIQYRSKELQRLEALKSLKLQPYADDGKSRENLLQLAVPSPATISHTLANLIKDKQPESGYLSATDHNEVEGMTLPDRLDPDSIHFSEGKWCFDTPGTVSPDQIINLLTAEEIAMALSTLPLIPRTLLMRVGHSLLLGGLGRLDYIDGPALPPVRVTVFTSSQLPVNMLETAGVEDFLANSDAAKLVKVPQGGPERMAEFPQLEAKELVVKGINDKVGSQDIVLSSAGWVMVSPRHKTTCRFLAHTPMARGISLRPPFLPHSVNQRGKRIQGSPAYKNDRLFQNEILVNSFRR